MRILMLSDYFPPHVGGGVERVVAELADGMVRRGHEVFVLSLRTCPAPATENKGMLTIHRVPAVDLTPHLGLQQTVSIQIFSSMARLVRRFGPDLIHAHNLFFRTTEVAALLRMIFRIPLITTLHLGKPEGSGRLLSALVKTYELTMGRFIVRQSDHVITVSKAVQEHACGMRGNSTRMTVIQNGVDSKIFYPWPDRRDAGQPVVLFVGRLVPNKGPDILIQAVPGVLARHPNAQFVLVGDGPLRDRLQQQAQHLGVGHAIRFLGIRTDVPRLMRDATIFVRPSSLEGMPLTVLEAMATSLAVVATPVGGTPEVVRDGVNGYLVPVGDKVALGNAIIKLLDDRALAEKMGHQGRELVLSRHTWDDVVSRTECVYDEEVNNR